MEVENNPDVLDLLHEEDEGALSFRDFPIHEPEPDGYSRDDDEPSHSPSRHELFEFGTVEKQSTNFAPGGIVFCGKLMDNVKLRDEDSISTERSLLSRSESFMRNQSFRYRSSSKSFSSPATGSYGYLRNNSRRPKVLIGLAKTPSKMELSEIRRRQARRAPVPMFPVVLGEEPIAGDSTDGGVGPWSLLRPFRCRSHPVRAMAKAASGCIPHV